MTGETNENVADATPSALTPPTGLTRREMREWERNNGITYTPTPSVPSEPPQSVVAAAVETTAPIQETADIQPMSRRERRLLEAGTGAVAITPVVVEPQPEILAEKESAPLVVENAPAAEVEIPAAYVPEPIVIQLDEEPVATPREMDAQPTPASPVTTAHKIIKRPTVRRPTFLSNRSKRERTAAEKRRAVTQRVVSVFALVASVAFALSMSIPATALLTQDQVAQMKMQSFIDEQVSLANQSVSVRSEAGAVTASRDGVDISYAAKATPVKYYDNSGLCGQETDVSVPVSGGPIVYPLEAPKISSGYGYRWGSIHAGIDFEGSVGIPIRSAADGIVKAVMPSAYNALGICTIVSHNVNGVQFDTLYGHLSSVDVSVGQVVTAGQYLGAMGSTGVSTGPHLHFEVHVGGVQIDPGPFMANYAG